MSELIRVPLAGGGSVLFEGTSRGSGGPVKTSRLQDRIEDASATLQEALESIVEASSAVLAQFSKVAPASIEVEFGVTLTGEVDAVIARAESECHFNVTLTWQRNDE